MKKILICNESINHGGIGTYTLSLIKELKKRGWEVSFLVTHGPGKYFSEVEKLADAVFNLSAMPLSFKKLKLAARIINKNAPDILLINHCSLVHYTLPVLSNKIKPIAVLHNDVELFYRVATLFNSRICQWIAPSEKLQITFQSRMLPHLRERVRTIGHGIDTEKFSAHQRRSNQCKIVFIGNLGKNKGADMLPDIFANVAKELENWKFIVAGEGDLMQPLISKLSQLGIPVRFAGYVSSENVPNLFSESDILLLPTRVEGFGLVIAEAMACGTVPVVSRLDGITDHIVEDGKSGMLVAVDDVEGYANAIIGLAKDSNRLASFSRNAVLSAKENFSLTRMLDDYERLFDEADTRSPKITASTLGWMLEVAREVAKRKIGSGLWKIRLMHRTRIKN